MTTKQKSPTKKILITTILIYTVAFFTHRCMQEPVHLEVVAFQVIRDIWLVQNEFKKRNLLDEDNNGVSEYADFESLLAAKIVIRNKNWHY